MNGSWTLVFSGNYASVLANQATLEASGISTYIPDSTTKVVDPFITGGDCLGAELHVQLDDAEEASEILNHVEGEPIERPSAMEFAANDKMIFGSTMTIGLIFAVLILLSFIAWVVGL